MDFQSNGGYRWPAELVQNFAYRGSSHRRKGAARHIIGIVWLYRKLILSGEEGDILLVQMIYLPSLAQRGGGGAPYTKPKRIIERHGTSLLCSFYFKGWLVFC